ncbi:hypothetical protein UA08_06301 [Talaromyces atroroseus]|uniref:Uncharacterized protein n=1 Tax=Talaromyces atroroseus TaxID=1441469 RepID=A0A225AZ10_TALAT|nr:hypothetical protein UA08_06301 [Talaromyces atroroseus]OKL58747.1 hypothetical protein UA08_06301 [Talaromyces atroroseus]
MGAAYTDEHRDSESSYNGEEDGLVSGVPRALGKKRFAAMIKLIPAFFVASLILNVAQFVYLAVHKPQCRSLFAKLPEREIEIPFHYATEYSDDEHTLEEKDALWNAIDVSDGFIAITHEEADRLGAPRSQVFPWDINKGMYVTHGYHALHCTVLLHAYTYDSHIGKKPLVSYHHIEHCLDLLRQDIICAADDFLDYTKDHGDQFLVAEGQPRQCRDWSKLEAWVKERSSCYKTVNITRAGEDHGIAHQLDRYTYCPPGSPYEPLVRAYKDLARVNSGNLDHSAFSELTPEEQMAELESVNEHNSAILNEGA